MEDLLLIQRTDQPLMTPHNLTSPRMVNKLLGNAPLIGLPCSQNAVKKDLLCWSIDSRITTLTRPKEEQIGCFRR